jgi:hypothetical protein
LKFEGSISKRVKVQGGSLKFPQKKKEKEKVYARSQKMKKAASVDRITTTKKQETMCYNKSIKSKIESGNLHDLCSRLF